MHSQRVGSLETFFGNETGVACGDISDEGNITADHDVIEAEL